MIAKDNDAKRAAQSLLARGLITIPEAMRLAGVSRFTICRWVKGSRAAYAKDRNAVIARLWRKELGNGPKLVERPKSKAGRSGVAQLL